MDSYEDADRCIKYLNQSVLEGRYITVERSRRKRPRTPTPGHYLGLKNDRDHGGRDRDSGRHYGRDDYRDRRSARRSPLRGRRDYSPPPSRERSRRDRSYSPYGSPERRRHHRGSRFFALVIFMLVYVDLKLNVLAEIGAPPPHFGRFRFSRSSVVDLVAPMKNTDESESSGSRAVVASPSHENPRHYRMKLDVFGEVLQRLQESSYEEASLPDFEDQLWHHFNRLPARYALDVKVERAEDVLTHQRLLKLAEDPATRPVFEVRDVQVSPRNSADSDPALEDDAQSSSKPHGKGILATPTFGSAAYFEAITQGSKIVEDDDSSVNATLATRPMHEITFSTIDKPKLLSQLTSLLSELGLNIQEAHAFSTVDGFSLDVFVVDGWSHEETDGLKDALGKEILKLKDQLGSRQKAISFFERDNSSNYLIPACIEIPTDGTDEWEIDVKQLQIEKKVASGSYGDLHRGTYCSQEVAIKFLKPERVNAEMLREFSQEVYIMRKIRHKNIVQFLGACTLSPTLCIIPYAYLTPLQAAVGVVQKGLRPKIPKKTHPKVKGLLQRCWNQDPKDRPEFEEIIEMLQQIMIEVGDEDPADKDKHCLGFLQAAFRKPRY
ncbi:hypothetical protein IGI04_025765 [Brassica rapa subsp. trilocularis]|uniref:Protein kinase domain-containing protein n=1 Tax=Brassica rapa subsp. trilocularis TaxID=1813537 RepID=A0ABQ7KXZ5_BRACM|nr:hypothetical protein IGI04_025765 [Brassica rapa subsp. trilocularis]